jgi:hypothetical protein
MEGETEAEERMEYSAEQSKADVLGSGDLASRSLEIWNLAGG